MNFLVFHYNGFLLWVTIGKRKLVLVAFFIMAGQPNMKHKKNVVRDRVKHDSIISKAFTLCLLMETTILTGYYIKNEHKTYLKI